MIKINCAVCGKEIINPLLRQKTCGGECSEAYKKIYNKARQTAYQKTDKWKAYQKTYRQRKKNLK